MKLRVPEKDGPALRIDGVPVYPGTYRVPEDMSQEKAQAIIEQGAGEVVQDEPVKAKKAKAETDILA